MPEADILSLRQRRQLLEGHSRESSLDPAGVVSRLGAMQAQDYAGALWSVGLRSRSTTTTADIERAIAERRIVRTWPMRGTLHFVGPTDVRWMLALLSDRVFARASSRHAQLDLTERDFERAGAIYAEALSGGRALSRTAMMSLLEANGIDPAGQRGYHILWVLALRGLLCCGPMEGTRQTFVLLDEWIPPDGKPLPDRPEALARLAGRYFAAHGPATLADFAWWAGITKRDARIGLDVIAEGLTRLAVGGAEYWLPGDVRETPARRPAARVHLLPGFDEFVIGYTDRALQLGEYRETYGATVSANGVFSPTLVIDGLIVGTWRRKVRRDHVDIAVRPFRTLSEAEERRLTSTAERYGRFLGLEAHVGLGSEALARGTRG